MFSLLLHVLVSPFDLFLHASEHPVLGILSRFQFECNFNQDSSLRSEFASRGNGRNRERRNSFRPDVSKNCETRVRDGIISRGNLFEADTWLMYFNGTFEETIFSIDAFRSIRVYRHRVARKEFNLQEQRKKFRESWDYKASKYWSAMFAGICIQTRRTPHRFRAFHYTSARKRIR